jgi:hypothetical protein
MADKIELSPLETEVNELLKLNQTDSKAAEKKFNSLPFEKRVRLVLSANGGDRERLVTLDRQSKRLVSALPPDEFTRSVLEVGHEDAGSLLALSSDSQLTYLFDITGWRQDKLDPTRYEVWLPLLLEAGAGRVLRWIESTDLEAMVLLFRHWFSVVKYLPSQEMQEPPDDLPNFTLDGVYFIDLFDKKSSDVVGQILVTLRNEKPVLYQSIMEAMLWEDASPVLEDALRWRNGRLMDHGFPDRMEALELWAKPVPGEADWQNHPAKDDLSFLADAPPRSDAVARLLPQVEYLPAMLLELSGHQADRLRAEMAYVANCGVVALDADPADQEEMQKAARESLGLANLGLALLSGGDRQTAFKVINRVGLPALARQGAEAIRELNNQAWDLIKEGWLQGFPTSLYVLDPPLDRNLAGLVYPRPRCYDPALPGDKEYRAFLNLADLEQSRLWLDQARFWGKLLFELMGLDKGDVLGFWQTKVFPEDAREIKTTAILGTWLARRYLGLTGPMAPLPRESFMQAVEVLKKELSDSLPEEIKRSCQAITDPKEAALAGSLLRSSLNRLVLELKQLNTDYDLDPGKTWGIITKR